MWFMGLHPTRPHTASRRRLPHLLPGVPATSAPRPTPAACSCYDNRWLVLVSGCCTWASWSSSGAQYAMHIPAGVWGTVAMGNTEAKPTWETSPSYPGLCVSWELASDFTKSSFRLSPGSGASSRLSSWKPTPTPSGPLPDQPKCREGRHSLKATQRVLKRTQGAQHLRIGKPPRVLDG